jgi:UPF0176 protein
MRLHNIYDHDTLMKRLEESGQQRVTLSFYKYARIGNPAVFRDHLYIMMDTLGVLGRIYVANEGINGQISVASENLSLLRHALDTIVFLEGCRLNVAIEDDGKSFLKLKVKVREKIVADGLTDFEFDGTGGGVHLDAKDWNALAKSEDAIIIDMRNHYETEVGRFEKAVLPDADTFRELLPMVENEFGDAKDRTVMMYCTGGIRCEKASAYLKAKGFSKVHQLNGGIIEYARQVREQGLDNRFKGKNFVFDERLGERISDDVIAHCHQCGAPCDDHTNCKNKGCNLLFIQCSACADKMQGCCCTECVTVYNMSEDEQRAYRKKQREAGVRYQKGRIRPRLTEAGESA